MSLSSARITVVTGAGRAVMTVWMTLAGIGTAQCGEPPARALEPEPRMQAAIEETVSAIARQDNTASESVASLKKLAVGQRDTLLLQMALYLEKSDGTERSMAGAILLSQLSFTPRETIETLLPHLDRARPTLRHVFTEMLGSIDRREGGEVDFRVYESWLAGRGGPPSSSLVRYLYEVSPDEALLSMRRVYGGPAPPHGADEALGDLQQLLARRDAARPLTDEERHHARELLESLGRDPAWWVRRYAATIVTVSPELGSTALSRRLKDDPEPLVRDALAP
jgi:hypothetical protein